MGNSGSPDFNTPGPETLQLLRERMLFKDEQRILDKRKIALTESGRLGLFSSRTVEGDVVCRLRGSKIFFVLHPIEVERLRSTSEIEFPPLDITNLPENVSLMGQEIVSKETD
jgi:hypothetical protein